MIHLSDVKLLKVRFANTDDPRFEVCHDGLDDVKGKGFVVVCFLLNLRYMVEDQFVRCKIFRRTYTNALLQFLTWKPKRDLSFFAKNLKLRNPEAYRHLRRKLFT